MLTRCHILWQHNVASMLDVELVANLAHSLSRLGTTWPLSMSSPSPPQLPYLPWVSPSCESPRGCGASTTAVAAAYNSWASEQPHTGAPSSSMVLPTEGRPEKTDLSTGCSLVMLADTCCCHPTIFLEIGRFD